LLSEVARVSQMPLCSTGVTPCHDSFRHRDR